jgi:ferric-dicitrate binding protein FerR (iron transport regulator)
MTTPSDQPESHAPNPRVMKFTSELTDGKLSEEQWEELCRLLADDEASLEWYVDWMSIHSCLHLDLALGQSSLTTSNLLVPLDVGYYKPRNFYRRHRRKGAIAALAALAAAIVIWAMSSPKSSSSIPQAPGLVLDDAARKEFSRLDENTVAILSRVAEAVSTSTSLTSGAAIPKGRFVLDAGVAQLEFLSGANLVIEGPADLDLLSTKTVFCRRGKLRARVPAQAHGFTIETPTHRAIDLGTEFAVDVNESSDTEVHVIEGEVKLQDKNVAASQDRRLLLGDAYRADASGQGSAIDADGDRFIGAERLIQLSEQDSESRYANWLSYSRSIARDSSVLAYYAFENHYPWSRVLSHDGPLTDPALEGAIVGCRWTEGRWRQKQALEFKGTEDRVRVSIPGEYESVSLACWVRVDGFDRWLGALLLTEGHDLGEVHWQFTETGQLLLGVKAELDKSQDYLSDVVLRPHDVGRWVHLACVYDHRAGTVTHYVDGRVIEELPIQKHITLRFGAAEIGNWQPENFIDHRIRSLNGRMDEFVLFGKALRGDQIREMYKVGQPAS